MALGWCGLRCLIFICTSHSRGQHVPNDVNRPVKDVNTMSQHLNAPAVDTETYGFPYVTTLHDTPCISLAYLCHITKLSKFFDSHKYREDTFSASESVQLGGPFTRTFVAGVPHKRLKTTIKSVAC